MEEDEDPYKFLENEGFESPWANCGKDTLSDYLVKNFNMKHGENPYKFLEDNNLSSPC